MLGNIVDRRTFVHNVQVDAIFEPSYHDNNCKKATQFEVIPGVFGYDEMKNTTVKNAVDHAISKMVPVTVYLYDVGSIGKTYTTKEMR